MEQFAKLPRWGQYLATLALGVVLLVAAWYGVISGQRQTLASLTKQSQDLEAQIRQGKEAQRRADELQRQIDLIIRELDVVKTIIPPEPETGKLLRVFQSFARDQNLDIKAISPANVTKGDLYSQQPYTVEVAGGYHDLAMFFDKLAHMRRIVNVADLDIKGSSQTKGSATITAKFQSIVYMQNPDAFQAMEKKP
ncbi:MAG: type 4a pilus biogenesis protein PilO [Acidobacteria bacterium]|jgi:type IV pilus assembly protein PilO|nr:type 4a pilus biogenesis protein PilO [Acidobacteriota bacterium]